MSPKKKKVQDLNKVLSGLIDEKIEKYAVGDEVWEENPVDINTFIDSPDYLNISDTLYPGVRNLLQDFLQLDEKTGWIKYNECIIIAGQGCGKSSFVSIVIVYLIYILLCMRDPQKFFNLSFNSRIQIINCAPSGEEAKKVVFGYISNFVNGCTWFKNKGYIPNPDVKSELQFPKGIYVTPGSSSAKPALGYNLLITIFDEMTSFDKTSSHDSCKELYNLLIGRMKRRFWGKELFLGISTAGTIDDFIEERFKECERSPKGFARRLSIWESKPFLFSGETFNYKVVDVAGNVIKELQIPVELKSDLETSPVAFLRDVVGIPSASRSPFFKDFTQVLESINKEKINPVPELGWDVGGYGKPLPFYPNDLLNRIESLDFFRGKPGVKYYIGLDLSKGVRDKCGFALVHPEKSIEVPKWNNEGKPYVTILPVIEVDLVTRFVAHPESEIDFGDIREVIFQLHHKLGFNIHLICSDSFESMDFKQIMIKSGYKYTVFSADTHREVFDTFLELIKDKRIIWYRHEPLLYELQRLEDLVTKIDHSVSSGKDITDALVLACYFAVGQELAEKNIKPTVTRRRINAVTAPGIFGLGSNSQHFPFRPQDKLGY